MATAQKRRRTKVADRSAESNVWELANRAAIEAYNARVEQHGVFIDEWQRTTRP